jgi:hypothetical protein
MICVKINVNGTLSQDTVNCSYKLYSATEADSLLNLPSIPVLFSSYFDFDPVLFETIFTYMILAFVGGLTTGLFQKLFFRT